MKGFNEENFSLWYMILRKDPCSSCEEWKKEGLTSRKRPIKEDSIFKPEKIVTWLWKKEKRALPSGKLNPL